MPERLTSPMGVALALVLASCSREGLIHPEWPDASAATMPDASAPPPDETCIPHRDHVRLVASPTLELPGDPEGLRQSALVGGILGDAERAWVLVSRPRLDDASAQWIVERVGDGGTRRGDSVGPLAIGPMGSAHWARGTLARTADGRTLAAWRTPIDELRSRVETQGAFVDGDVAEPIAPMHSVARGETLAISYGTPAIVAMAGRTYIASPTASGIFTTPLDAPAGEDALVVPTEGGAESLVSGVIDDRRIAFAWVRVTGSYESAVHTAVLDVETRASVTMEVFTPRRFGALRAALVVTDGTLRLAAFRADPTSLRDGHIAIAHLDATLARIEPDREVRGWGGLATDAIDAVRVGGEPWLFVRTNDVALVGRSALYAIALDDAECVDGVGEPLLVLPRPAEVHIDAGDLRAFSTGDVGWIAMGRAATEDTISVARVTVAR